MADRRAWHRIISWDHREQIDLDELETALKDLTDNKLFLRTVRTGSDQYAIVVARWQISQELADRKYELWLLNDDGDAPQEPEQKA